MNSLTKEEDESSDAVRRLFIILKGRMNYLECVILITTSVKKEKAIMTSYKIHQMRK